MPASKQFSKRAQKVLLLANRESRRFHCPHVASEHLLLGALAYRSPIISASLTSAGLALRTLRDYIAEVGSAAEEAPHGYGPTMRGALHRSYQHSEALLHKKIEPEHLILGVLDETDGGAARALRHFGVDVCATKRHIIKRIRK
jgi:ATP-dependent Clp protease ATP-binding subunit ClpC